MAQTSYSLLMEQAIAGLLADSGYKDAWSAVNAEASAEIPFGVMVARGSTENKCIKLVDTNSVLLGVHIFSNEYAKDQELGSTGIKPGVMMNILRKGRIWVVVEEIVAKDEPCYVRYTASGGNTTIGAFRNDDDTSKAKLVPGARFIAATTGAGLALVEIDMPANFAANND